MGAPPGVAEARPVPRVQRLRVVAVATPSYRRLPTWRARIGDRVDSAADLLAARFGIELHLARVASWDGEADDLDALLQAVSGAHPDADLVMSFTAAPPPRRARMRDMVRALYAGRAVALRSQTTWFRPAETEAVHHAEVRALLQGVGTVFGALPDCPPSLMAERPSFEPLEPQNWRWSPLNLALVRIHATLDLRAPGKVPADIALRALEAISAAGAPRCEEDAVARRKVLLGAVVQAASAPEDPQQAKDAAELARGQSALEAHRYAEALERCGAVAVRDPASGAARCAGFALEAQSRWDEAVAALRAHLAHHPDDEEAVLVLARAVGRAGDDGAARALLVRYVEAHPEHLRARVNLGVAHARLGDYEAARAQWQSVLERDPKNADALDLLSRLPR